MELSNLNAFVAVAEKLSFSAAAESLYLTQPAISKRIASLESELNAKLFDRIGRRIKITPAGEALLPTARRIIRDLKESTQIISALSGQISGRLSIGTSHHVGLHRLPPVLKQFTQAHPEVELDLRFMDSEQACFAVERGELELAVVTLPETSAAPLETQVIWPDPLDIVAAADHPLANSKRISIEKLADHPAIFPGIATFTRRILEAAIQPYGLKLNVSMETNYLETIKMLVSIGLGWSVLPRSMTDKEMVSVNVKGIKIQRQLGTVQHKSHTLTTAGRRFLEFINNYQH